MESGAFLRGLHVAISAQGTEHEEKADGGEATGHDEKGP